MGSEDHNYTRILFVDDDTDDLMIFSDALSELDIPLEITHIDGCDSLQQFLDHPGILPDIIFLDVNMPGINGIDCLHRIKRIEKLSSVPVVMYSTSSHEKNVEQSMLHGASLYVVKPSSFERLKTIMSRILKTDWANFIAIKNKFFIK